MTVVHKPFVITNIEEIQKAELNIMGKIFNKNPNLDMYRITAILKSYVEKTSKGRELLKKLGLEEKLDDLDMKYIEYAEAFTVTLPVTHQTINWDKYHIGGEIMIAYYPTNVWATFHAEGKEDNISNKKRLEG